MGGNPAEEEPQHLNYGKSSVFNEIPGFWTSNSVPSASLNFSIGVPELSSLAHPLSGSPTRDIEVGDRDQFTDNEDRMMEVGNFPYPGSGLSYLGDVSKEEYETIMPRSPSNAPPEVTNRSGKECTFYRIMTLETDNQDLSFVEKVILPWPSMSSLCNELVSQSAKVVDGRRIIDFERLNSIRMKMVGVFGAKPMIGHFLKRMGLEVDTELYKAIESDKLAPGLYAWLHRNENSTHVFLTYWHAGSALPKASRKDVSCNFIRYIFDLCDNVFVCLDAAQVRKSLSSDILCLTKQERTQRLRIGLVKAPEDSINVIPGFILESELLKSIDYIHGKNVKEYRLTEGHHRIALLICTKCPRKKSSRRCAVKWSETQLSGLFKENKNCNVDFTQLPDMDFVELLSITSMEQLIEWQQLKELHLKESRSLKDNAYSDELIKGQHAALNALLSSCVDCCLQYAYPWEERLCAPTISQLPSPVLSRGNPGNTHPCSGSDPRGAHEESTLRNHSPDSRKQFQESMSMLQEEIHKVLLGESSSRRTLIYQGSRICIDPPIAGISEPYTVEYCSGTPFAVYRSTLKLSLTNSAGEKEEFEAEISSAHEKHFQGPILTDDLIEITVKFSVWQSFKGHRKIRIFYDTGLQSWLLAVARNTMLDLRNRAIFLSFVMVYPFWSTKWTSDKKMLTEILVAHNALKVLERILEKDAFTVVSKFWALYQHDPTVRTLPFTIQQDVMALCTHQHKELRGKLLSNVCATFKRCTNEILTITNMEKFKNELSALVKDLDGRKSSFLSSKKRELSTKNQIEGLDKLSVLKFSASRWAGFWSSDKFSIVYEIEDWETDRVLWQGLELAPMKNDLDNLRSFWSSDKFSIVYEIEDWETDRVLWQGLELAPMKNDLDNLRSNSDVLFTPTLSKANDIIYLDPQSQTLVKAVFLKAGQLLLFVEDTSEKCLNVYLCSKFGTRASQLVVTMKRGYNLVAFDEITRIFALYSEELHSVKSCRFDEQFRKQDWVGADVNLHEYAGIQRLTWMDFVAGKKELVFIDASQIVRICNMTTPALVRPGNIHLGTTPIWKVCISPQTNFLMVMRKVLATNADSNHRNETDGSEHDDSGDHDEPMTADSRAERCEFHALPKSSHRKIVMESYKIHDAIEHFSTLDICMSGQSKAEMSVVRFASQVHLVMHSHLRPNVVQSTVLKFTSSSEVCQLQQIQRPVDAACMTTEPKSQPGPVLDYIYQIFEKFSTYPPLTSGTVRRLDIKVLLAADELDRNTAALAQKCVDYVESSVCRLKTGTGKDFSRLNMNTSVLEVAFGTRPDSSESDSLSGLVAEVPSAAVGDWIKQLVCLVPIQIARAENNALKPLVDGIQLSSSIEYVDAISLAKSIQFGLYETVLDGWKGPIKVLSSMGKQSTGKSYLLNHLSGSLLDIAGGRCTDGVWMTVRMGNGCLYVLLDFEGLGSFERSEQEDMLLSLLNAAISNFTIFNKKDFHLDKETESIFERFQNAVSLVKTDPKLFNGLFYIAIKDVHASDVEDLKKEFISKISHMCTQSEENFLTIMYGGTLDIAAMPSFDKPEFYESVGEIARTVEEIVSSYDSGQEFLSDLKLLIAQVATKDWSPIDAKRVALRVDLLLQHMKAAVGLGCTLGDVQQPLVCFRDQALVPDDNIQVDDYNFCIRDTGLELVSFSENAVIYELLSRLMAIFTAEVHRTGKNDEQWHLSFENFIAALIQRRRHRVMQWVTMNTAEFLNEGDGQRPKMEAESLLAALQQTLLLCSCKCSTCFLRCVREKRHPSSHTCMGNHKCTEMCTYCTEENSTEESAGYCDDVAGHAGPHDCRVKCHTCGETCVYFKSSSNCNESCSKKLGHDGVHRCNSSEHACREECSLPMCKNPCVCPIEVGDHSHHFCHEKHCPVRCHMPDCNRTCATQNHFHSTLADALHMCRSEHPCTNTCENDGICEVLTEVTKRTLTFRGKRDTFDYEAVSEQQRRRKRCCLVIPPFQQRHDEMHSCSTNEDVAHYCETRCPSCGYFCTKVMGHTEKHNTSHGNMRSVFFVAESEEIDISGRKYSWGESGVAELCHLHCRAQGRGHIHIMRCPESCNTGPCRKLSHGSRHETCKYGPNADVPKDELTHAAYWKYVNFVDPCTPGELKQFALCNYKCKFEKHSSADGTAATPASYSCTESLWHKPILTTAASSFGNGYITEDGHHFSCDHSENMATNVIFVIDRSSSMAGTDIQPSMVKFFSHNNRLGCVYEAVLRFIKIRLTSVQQDVVSVVLFNGKGDAPVWLQDMEESIVNNLLTYEAAGITTYRSGLRLAESIILESLQYTDSKPPVIIFLSDGEHFKEEDPVSYISNLMALDPRLLVHTILFGDNRYKGTLADMAKAGNGTFEASLDAVQLSRRFEWLAKSIKPGVSSLLRK